MMQSYTIRAIWA